MSSYSTYIDHKTNHLVIRGSREAFERDVQAEICRRSFLDFVKTLRPDWELPFFQLRIIEEIQKWVDSASYNLILSLPPGHGKSEFAKLASAWTLIRDRESQIAYCSYAADLAKKQLGHLYAILDSDIFIYFFGRYLNAKNVVSDLSRGKARTQDYAEIVGSEDGHVLAIGRTGGLTGYRADLGVIDDLLKDAPDARSKASLQECRDWYAGVLSTRKRPYRPFRVLVLATRWSKGDLTGWLLSEQPDLWREVRFPAIKESPPDDHDPREIGEPLWETVETAESLRARKALDPELFQAQYQQSPVAEGGNLFRSDWLSRRWTSLPDRDGLWIQSWDLRGGGSAHKGSHAVGQLWFRPSASSDLYLVDQVRGRWSPDETYSVIRKQCADPLWSKAKAKIIERKADGVGALSLLQREIPGLIGVNPSSDKETRARSVTAYFAAQNVLLPQEAHWLSDYISELLSFPASSNDDQVDATSQALSYYASQVSSGPPRVINVGSRSSGLNKF